jgi:hypothetical protein
LLCGLRHFFVFIDPRKYESGYDEKMQALGIAGIMQRGTRRGADSLFIAEASALPRSGFWP